MPGLEMYIPYMIQPKSRPIAGRKAVAKNAKAKAAGSFKLASASMFKTGRITILKGPAPDADVISAKLPAHQGMQKLFSSRMLGLITDVVGGPVVELNVSNARAQMPKIIKASTDGKSAFLIGSAHNRETQRAVLIGEKTLELMVHEASKPVKTRTLGEILDSLPFSGMEIPRLRATPLHSDDLPVARIRK